MTTDRLASLYALAEPLAASLGLILWGIELTGSGRPVVRIFVDAQQDTPVEAKSVSPEQDDISIEFQADGVSVDQCARLSRLLGLSMDVEAPFASAWTLEISSPGLERVFFRPEQLSAYVGDELEVALYQAHPDWPTVEGLSGRKKFRGVLRQTEAEAFVLTIAEKLRTADEPETLRFEWDSVRRVQRVHTFPEPGLPKKQPKNTVKNKTTSQSANTNQP